MAVADLWVEDDAAAYIDGRSARHGSGPARAIEDPSTGTVIASVADATEGQVDTAVASARACFEGEWSAWKPAQRAELLRRFRTLVDRDYEQLAMTETYEMGAPISRVGVARPRTLGLIDYNAAAALTHRGALVPNSSPGDITTWVVPEPVGVVGAITPWNASINSVIWKVAPAIAVGCTVVVKPSELTPLCALKLARLLTEAGAPPGLMNVVPGDGTTGATLVAHGDVDKIAFTGSTASGQAILASSASNLKRVSLELGGKSANIVFPDADIEAAAVGAVLASFSLTGQACTAGSRLFVHASINDEFVERFGAIAGQLKIGPGIVADTQLGPLVSEAQLRRVVSFIDDARVQGLEVVSTGGEPKDSGGHYLAPTLVLGPPDSARVVREEIFGPVVTVMAFDEEDEVVRRANSLPYGLVAGVWSRDVATTQRLSRRLKAGTIWINCYNKFDPAVPFGGVKMSGFGRESGLEHLDEFTSPKAVWLGG